MDKIFQTDLLLKKEFEGLRSQARFVRKADLEAKAQEAA
jgi:hypothetical protein